MKARRELRALAWPWARLRRQPTLIPGGNRDVRLDLEDCAIATHNVLEAMRLAYPCMRGPTRVVSWTCAQPRAG